MPQLGLALSAVIAAIEDGHPEIHDILHLVGTDPTSGWTSDKIGEKQESTKPESYEGIEILTESRIIDLRRWHPNETHVNLRGRIYVRDRITLKFTDSYKGNRHVTFGHELPLEDVEFCQRNSQVRGTISRIVDPMTPEEKQRFYETEYDLSGVPTGEPVTLELETLAVFPRFATPRAPLRVHGKTDLLTVWLLFPEDRPYREFRLVRYSANGNKPPDTMDVRYTIDHPHGTLIGWSVVNPQSDTVYECRWDVE